MDTSEYQQPLFIGLTKPAMVLGVPMAWFGASVMLSAMAFIGFNSLVWITLIVPLHGLGYLISLDDPQRISVIFTALIKTPRLTCKRFLGANVYRPD